MWFFLIRLGKELVLWCMGEQKWEISVFIRVHQWLEREVKRGLRRRVGDGRERKLMDDWFDRCVRRVYRDQVNDRGMLGPELIPVHMELLADLNLGSKVFSTKPTTRRVFRLALDLFKP